MMRDCIFREVGKVSSKPLVAIVTDGGIAVHCALCNLVWPLNNWQRWRNRDVIASCNISLACPALLFVIGSDGKIAVHVALVILRWPDEVFFPRLCPVGPWSVVGRHCIDSPRQELNVSKYRERVICNSLDLGNQGTIKGQKGNIPFLLYISEREGDGLLSFEQFYYSGILKCQDHMNITALSLHYNAQNDEVFEVGP